MKKLAVFICAVSLSILSLAQTSGFSYQAVVRNYSGELLKNRNIGVRVTILKGSTSGMQVYSETHTTSTNANGLITLEIGSVYPTTFAVINWADGPYFLKTDTDPNGGTGYSITGTSQLLSVPYALWAVKAGNGFSGNYQDLTNKPNLSVVATTGNFTDLLNLPILVSLSRSPMSGDMVYYDGAGWQTLGRGSNGQTLRLDNGLPKWAEPGYSLPIITTLQVTDVMQTAAKSGGNIVNAGFSEITARGVCWSVNQNPTVADSKTSEGSGTGGSFISGLTGLLANTIYYVRAYATNGAGTAYGNQVSFKTYHSVVFPTITTAAPTNVLSSTATSGGNITETGGDVVTARGVCWSTNQNPTMADNKSTDGSGTGQYSSAMIGLDPGTVYYVRAFATNSAGTGYGNQVTLTTQKTVPILSTKAITDISAMGAVSGGTITATGGSSITEKGICWGENQNPTLSDNVISAGTGQSAFSCAIIKAIPNTTYYVRAYAKNELGTGYGDQKTFISSEAAYFQSFEAGVKPQGWGGEWTVSKSISFIGSYCLTSLPGVSSDATYSVTLTNPGQISFYYYLNCGQYGCSSSRTSMDFYIDNNKMINYPASSGWNQGSFDLSSGTHTLKWHFNASYGGNGYIDYIVISK